MALAETGITVSMVKNALGVSSTDVGALCKSENINCWSKKKPVILPNAAPDRDSDWWKSTDGNCGLSPYLIINYTNIPNAYQLNDDNMNGWVYNKPYGTNVAPYRLADFGGYDHNANPPLRNFWAPATQALNGGNFSCTCIQQVASNTSLIFSDFTSSLKDYYFGAYITNGTAKQIATSTSNLSNGGSTVNFTMTGFSTGTWTAYPFLAENKITQNGSMTANSFYSVPMLVPTTITIISSNITITITAVANYSSNTVSYTIKINNLTSGNITFTNNYLRLRYSNKSYTDPLILGEQQLKLSDYTAPSGVSTMATGNLTAIDDIIDNCKLWVSLNSGAYLQSAIVMQQA